MRLIDADRLKEVLERNFGNIGGANVLKQLIDNAPTVEEDEVLQQSWKSVKEHGIPPIDEAYEDKYCANKEYIVLIAGAKIPTVLERYKDYFGDTEVGMVYNVDYYMDMPKSPKESSEEV